MKKKKFKIKLYSGDILSYRSIENAFNSKMGCKIFDADINLFLCNSSFDFFFDCKINKYSSVELILEELNNYFTTYSIKKEKNKDVLQLEGMLRKNSPFLNNLCDPKGVREEGDFSIFIENKEIKASDIKDIIKKTTDVNIKEVLSIQTHNYENFIFTYFNCENETKRAEFKYEDMENIKN